jgi:beta-lactamase class A
VDKDNHADTAIPAIAGTLNNCIVQEKFIIITREGWRAYLSKMNIRKYFFRLGLRFSLLLITLCMISGRPIEIRAAEIHDWAESLARKIEEIDRATPGNLGVYVKHPASGRVVNWNADRTWYLASTVKVPIAIALLKMVEEGTFSLDDKLALRQTDFVDGGGDLLRMPPGAEFTLESLMRRMLVQSDNTASDMLIRLIGEDEINRRIVETMAAEGIMPVTTLLQVRYDAYSEIHPDAAYLSNMDIVQIQAERQRERRFVAFMDKLRLNPGDVTTDCVEKAFELYYQRNFNSGTLRGMGLLLERLSDGELLSDEHTRALLDIMENIVTGDRRIKAGLPGNVLFAQKTGTQIERVVNVGIINPGTDDAIIVTAVIEKFGMLHHAENALEQVGRAISESGILAGAADRRPFIATNAE